MDAIGSEMESILMGHDMSKPLVVPNITPGSDLASLVNSFCSDGMGAGHGAGWLKRCASKFGPRTPVKALLVTALRDWIFATSFPNFAPSDLRLLRAYRDAVMIHGQ